MKSTHDLARLVARKREVLAGLLQLARKQRLLADESELTPLLALLAGKQRLLNELETLERALDPYRSDEPDERIWDSPAERARCADDAELCRGLLRELIALEQECEQRLTSRRDETAQRIDKAHSVHATRQAYASAGDHAAPRLDLTSDT